jgi:hypothetical protein
VVVSIEERLSSKSAAMIHAGLPEGHEHLNEIGEQLI